MGAKPMGIRWGRLLWGQNFGRKVALKPGNHLLTLIRRSYCCCSRILDRCFTGRRFEATERLAELMIPARCVGAVTIRYALHRATTATIFKAWFATRPPTTNKVKRGLGARVSRFG